MMKRDGGLAGPMMFALPISWFGLAAASLYEYLSAALTQQNVLESQALKNLPPEMLEALSFSQSLTGLMARLVLLPIVVTVALFLFSGLIHLCLLLLGGLKQPFEATFRVASYGLGSVVPFLLVPICGDSIAFVWLLVLLCIGMAKAHEISTAKAVTVVILPIFSSCCCGLSVIAGTYSRFFVH